MANELMTVREAAELLSVSVGTVYEWSEAGTLPSLKVGRLRRFRRTDLEQWLDERMTGGQPSTARKSEEET